MTANINITQQISEFGIVPVVVINNAADAVPLTHALAAGGLPIAEITFRTDAAEDAIKRIAAERPEILLGAGTILTIAQAEAAIKAGAKFIVTPGFSSTVVTFCQQQNIPIVPGVATPTEIQMALEHGLDVVKFFPADAFGGIKSLKAMSAPYKNVKFIPTGGISAANVGEYIRFPKILACGGSWMVKDELIRAQNFEEITKLTREAVLAMLGFEIHGAIPGSLAASQLDVLKRQFGVAVENAPDGSGSVTLQTNSLSRAIAYLVRAGLTTAKPVSGTSVLLSVKSKGIDLTLQLAQKPA